VGGGTITSSQQSVAAQLAAGLVETIDYSTMHAFIRTKAGDLYTVGNSSKRPMITTADRYDTPFNVSSTNSLNFLGGQTIDQFALGNETTIILTTTGQAFTSGGNSDGQWGQGTTKTFGRARPENINANFTSLSETDRIVGVYASTSSPVVHMARSLEGKIYVWGANLHAEDTSYASVNFTGKSGSGLTDTLSITYPLDITDLFLEIGEASSSTPPSTSIDPTTSEPTSSQPSTSQPDPSEPPTGPRTVNPAAVVITTIAVAGAATFSYFFFFRGLVIGSFSFVSLKAWFALLLKRKKDKDEDKKK